jgi:hypothetical protein
MVARVRCVDAGIDLQRLKSTLTASPRVIKENFTLQLDE